MDKVIVTFHNKIKVVHGMPCRKDSEFAVTHIHSDSQDFVVIHESDNQGASITNVAAWAVPAIAAELSLDLNKTNVFEHYGVIGSLDAEFDMMVFNPEAIGISRDSVKGELPMLSGVGWRRVEPDLRVWLARMVFEGKLHAS